MPTLKEFIEEREKEFEGRFVSRDPETGDYDDYDFTPEEIKDFLRQSLLAYAEMVREEIRRIDVSGGGSGRRLKEQLLSSPLLLEELKK